MKYVDEYRHADDAYKIANKIKKTVTKPWKIMEVCGGQTHAIAKYGIDKLLPKEVEIVHGPGCPVCVTAVEIIDKALEIAANPNVIFCSFGDMLRVPGSKGDLFRVKADGGDVRFVYSPTDAVKIAQANPNKEVVFFAVGFETTAPANAMAVYQAAQKKLSNFSILVSHVLVPPAIEAILQAENTQVQGFLAAGHVCMVMGYEEYQPIAKKYKVPIVVTGFEPLDILQGTLMCLEQLESGRAEVENQYVRSVHQAGNLPAQKMIQEIFCIIPRKWRGIGEIAASGLGVREKYKSFDALEKFGDVEAFDETATACISGIILQGIKKPFDCPAFGKECTPEHPLGATMVSSEGACAAYFRYRALEVSE